jgi:hypothetical protein
MNYIRIILAIPLAIALIFVLVIAQVQDWVIFKIERKRYGNKC